MSKNGKGHIQRSLDITSKEEFDDHWMATFGKCCECGARDKLFKSIKLNYFNQPVDIIICENCNSSKQ
jgi:hypothetical protein